MIANKEENDTIRRKIKTLTQQLSLPTVRRALGLLEGEHSSTKRGGEYDYQTIRPYEIGDESRFIDWRTSARMGRPMVIERERLLTTRSWLLMDVGEEMLASTPQSERAATVAANALRLFGSLCIRRSDDVSLVLADSATITRIPCKGGFAAFEKELDASISERLSHPRNIGALLDYANHIHDRNALIILATDETAIHKDHLKSIRRLARTHPLIVVSVSTLNPFKPNNTFHHVADGYTGKRVPAFMRTKHLDLEVQTHRHYQYQSLKQDLARTGSQLVYAQSSEDMLLEFMHMLTNANLAASSKHFSQLGTV